MNCLSSLRGAPRAPPALGLFEIEEHALRAVERGPSIHQTQMRDQVRRAARAAHVDDEAVERRVVPLAQIDLGVRRTVIVEDAVRGFRPVDVGDRRVDRGADARGGPHRARRVGRTGPGERHRRVTLEVEDHHIPGRPFGCWHARV
ncbi:MAG: hypothetical protein QM749_04580 [Aquabacterium sp.]